MAIMTHHNRDHIDDILAQWHRERPDLDVGPMAIVGRLFRATALADAALTPSLSCEGVRAAWRSGPDPVSMGRPPGM